MFFNFLNLKKHLFFNENYRKDNYIKTSKLKT